MSKVTIEDVARAAGVSKTTVSRVLNRRLDVNPLTADRVCPDHRQPEFRQESAAPYTSPAAAPTHWA